MKGVNHETFLKYFLQKKSEHAPGVPLSSLQSRRDGGTRGDGSALPKEEEE